ncbi:ATP-dependent DNA ligase [Nocardioides scoriae]|uniref:DNA ligase (ATP) n=1 Tax=Nocardioides scoriae TaxID=642780 RepID=A0A1H1MS27_9ACTN|nr:ATP-dependent DNA ligase [Nocardioides scoriae]
MAHPADTARRLDARPAPGATRFGGVDLPVMPPVRPMLAKSVKGVPDPAKFPGGLSFEPKWDGFRCLVFRDGDEVELTSRNTKPLTRYFPEVVEAVRELLPRRCVLDGELFVALGDRLEFEVLQERIHPAASRIAMLSEKTPASFVAFDALALGDDSLVAAPFSERRDRLEQALGDLRGPAYLTRTTTDPAEAERWFDQFEGAGLDGVVAKPMGAAYDENARTMLKIKHARTADVVVAGYRLHKNSTEARPLLGSLLLGLHDDEGRLQHVGVAASFTEARRAALVEELRPLECPIDEHPWQAWAGDAVANPDRVPGTQSRWSAGKDLSFTPLRPERVLEVGYEHMEGRRFRHTAQFKRWRPDRDPASCGYGQLEEVVGYDLTRVLRIDPEGSGT